MATSSCSRKRLISSILYKVILSLQIHHISAQTYLGHSCINNDINSTTGFQANLNTILSTLSSDIKNGFYSNSVGDGVDRVNAIAQCRGDIVDIETCGVCFNESSRFLTLKSCPNQTEAIIWYEECMFRYTNDSIYGIMSLVPAYKLTNTQNPPNLNLITEALSLFANDLVSKAAVDGFAADSTSNPDVQTFYGYMQCTHDINASDCRSCLESIARSLKDCCYEHQAGARWITPSCSFRYETYKIINEISAVQPPLPPPTSSPPPPPPPTGKGKGKRIIIVVCVIISLLVLSLAVCVLITRRRRQQANTRHKREEDQELEESDDTLTRKYDFALIRSATDGFSINNTLGRGGFGEVYKGVLSDGKEIAVKRLSTKSGQGEIEFMNEVKLLAKLQHKCLVRLLGYCIEQTERLLIYEFMENGSLDSLLFDAINRSILDWERRYKIIKSIAKGLLYLHEDSRLMIIHRDLKASNILLDVEMNAKISDFGMARLFVLDEGEVLTNKIAGTFGYMAPEYAMHGLFSVKSDVYSYGVLLLEIISGKKNNSYLTENQVEDLPSRAYKTWKEDKASDLIDPMLTVDSDSESLENIMRCIHIALLCVQENVGNRPTMAIVVLMLQSSNLPLPTPSEPGFFSSGESFTLNWPSFSNYTGSSSSNSQSKPILLQADRSDRALNVLSYSHNNHPND